MAQLTRTALGAVLTAAMSTAGLAAVGSPASAGAHTPTPPPPAATCTDPITGIPLLASWTGTSGDDVIRAQPGAVLVALAGDDVVWSDIAAPVVTVCLGDGADWFTGGSDNPFPPGQAGIDGGNGPDNILGTTGADTLLGGAGNDVLTGGPGKDTVDGGPGIDQCDAEIELNCER